MALSRVVSSSIAGIGFALLILGIFETQAQDFGKPCDGNPQSKIYCYGDLLSTVQQAKLYPDQKTFVDRPLKFEPAVVLENFSKLGFKGGNLSETSKGLLLEFIEKNFERNGTEFETWNPEDWKENPSFLTSISDKNLRQWASDLHEFWKQLGRKIREDVKTNSTRHSMYYVSHPVIVPGGRFKEFYYWDSYWIQRGLLVSGMTETVKGMILNFFEMVEMLGFIPNGGRIYYQRSQPPLLIPMVDAYYEATKDLKFLKDNIATMIDEFKFFINKRNVTVRLENGNEYLMVRYNVELTDPRPESYSEDLELVDSLPLTLPEEKILYANLKSGAESGWDFSSRWFVVDNNESPIKGNLSHTKTRNIIPVDLNSFIYWNAVLLDKFCGLINDNTVCNSTEFRQHAAAWKVAIQEVLWDEDAGIWFDFDYVKGEKRRYFFPTNIAPLWTNAHHGDNATVAKQAVNYLHASGAINFPGGIPTSMLQTGQQWDFPNAWPPLQHIVVEALENSGEPSAKDLAFQLAEKWIQSNHLAYVQTESMFEKYDATIVGGVGSGGEYEVVVGFGWSNGVVLDFLRKYGQRLKAFPNLPTPPPENGSSSLSFHNPTALIVVSTVINRLCNMS